MKRDTPHFLATLLRVCIFSSFSAGSAHALDTNGNGLDDIWEVVYSASALTAGADADADGFNNGAESAAGTNPFDAASRPELRIARFSQTQLELGFTEVAGNATGLNRR